MSDKETFIPGEESKKLASALVDGMFKDKIFDPYENGYKINTTAVTARIASALENSWQQGLDDAITFARVMALRGKT